MLGRVTHAILRTVGKEIQQGLSQDPAHAIPDPALAQIQHSHYTKLLKEMGLKTTVLPADPAFPDGTFVEDTYVILPEVIIQMRPGANSRLKEGESLRNVLPTDRPCLSLPSLKHADGREVVTIDGGDVLRMNKRLYVGISSRTTEAAVNALRQLLKSFNYEVISFVVPQGLHLKSGVSCIADRVFVLEASFAEAWRALHKTLNEEIICHIVDEQEKLAANLLPVDAPDGQFIVMPPHCKNTFNFVKNYYAENNIKFADESEFNKIDGALTCKSLLFYYDTKKTSQDIDKKTENQAKHVLTL